MDDKSTPRPERVKPVDGQTPPEKEAAKKLAKPPRDPREVTIGPTIGNKPDITVGYPE